MAANKKTQAYLDSERYQKIKNDLMEQLEIRGTPYEFYRDLVEDYMDIWVTKCLLVDDIQQRGVTVLYHNGGGQKGRKGNDSIEKRIKVNAQMLKLLSELGIKPSGTEGTDESEEM